MTFDELLKFVESVSHYEKRIKATAVPVSILAKRVIGFHEQIVNRKHGHNHFSMPYGNF